MVSNIQADVRGFATSAYRTFRNGLCAAAALVAAASGFAGSAHAQELQKVSLALNYTMGSSHGGLAAAMQLGYFKEAGLEVTVVPWSAQTRSETLVTSGQVNFAFVASTDDALINIAAGRPITVLGAYTQHDPVLIGVRSDSDIDRPAKISGRVYGGFGSAKEDILLKALIEADGGKAEFSNVTLGTAAYEAVHAQKVDAALFFSFSDAVNAQLRGREFRYFKYADYGVPDQYATLITANSDYLAKNGDVARKLLAALEKGYRFEQDNAEKTVEMLAAAGSTSDPEFLLKSIEAFTATLEAPDGSIGTMDLAVWQQRAEFWLKHSFLVNSEGNALTALPDLAAHVTNDYLPKP